MSRGLKRQDFFHFCLLLFLQYPPGDLNETSDLFFFLPVFSLSLFSQLTYSTNGLDLILSYLINANRTSLSDSMHVVFDPLHYLHWVQPIKQVIEISEAIKRVIIVFVCLFVLVWIWEDDKKANHCQKHAYNICHVCNIYLGVSKRVQQRSKRQSKRRILDQQNIVLEFAR